VLSWCITHNPMFSPDFNLVAAEMLLRHRIIDRTVDSLEDPTPEQTLVFSFEDYDGLTSCPFSKCILLALSFRTGGPLASFLPRKLSISPHQLASQSLIAVASLLGRVTSQEYEVGVWVYDP